MVPAMIYIIGMPTIAAIGTDLFQIVLTSANVTLQQAISTTPSTLAWPLILLTALPSEPSSARWRPNASKAKTDTHPAGHHRTTLTVKDVPGPGAHPQRSGESWLQAEGDTKMKRLAILSLACLPGLLLGGGGPGLHPRGPTK